MTVRLTKLETIHIMITRERQVLSFTVLVTVNVTVDPYPSVDGPSAMLCCCTLIVLWRYTRFEIMTNIVYQCFYFVEFK